MPNPQPVSHPAGSLSDLQARHALPGVVRFDAGPGGLTRVTVACPSADAEIFLHGAHVARWQPRGQAPVLFMSEKSLFDPAKAIRGGVPLIFPWFGPRAGHPESPMHGFARVADWGVESVRQGSDGSVEIVLALDSSDATRAAWPHDFSARFRVTVAAQLTMTLAVRNASAEAFPYEEALHSYFRVSDVRNVSVTGLEDTPFIDKTDAARRKTQGPDPLRITGETDRVYLNTKSACVIDDPGGPTGAGATPIPPRRIVVEKSGSDATVLWNPWVAKAKAMADFGDDEWPDMLCIETCNAADAAVNLAPGKTHEMTAIVRCAVQ